MPESVAVLPFDNQTPDLQGPGLVRKMVFERVPACGYRSLGLEEIDSRLHGIGITDGGQLGAVETAKLGELLGGEGLLYGTLEEFAFQNVGVVRRRLVRLRLKLIEASSGEKLWEGVGVGQQVDAAVKKKDITRSFIEGLVERVAEKALGVALQPESRKAVEQLFREFPKR